jgi:amidase
MVSQRGHVPPKPGSYAERDLNVIGPLARSARDLRLLLSVIENGPLAAKAPPADLPGLKLGLWLEEPAFILDAEVKAAIETFASEIAGQGVEVIPMSGFIDAQALLDAYRTLLGATVAEDMPPSQIRTFEMIRGPSQLALRLGASPDSAPGLAVAYTARHADWVTANEVRARITHQMTGVFGRVDAILAPATPVTAFPHDHRAIVSRKLVCSSGEKVTYLAMLRWIALATACGLPATTVPAGLSGGGLPVGAQIIGPRGGDARTLAIAQALEERLGGFISPPQPETILGTA